MNNLIKLSIISTICLTMPSCSVFMAAHKKGVDFTEFAKCQTKECIYSNGAVFVKRDKDGDILKAEKQSGSAARAAMHGVLDVATVGIWEVAGTPIEGSMDKEGFYYFRVTYKEDGQTIRTIELAR